MNESRGRGRRTDEIKHFILFIAPSVRCSPSVTFFVMLYVFNFLGSGTSVGISTGWYVESLMTQTLILTSSVRIRSRSYKAAPVDR